MLSRRGKLTVLAGAGLVITLLVALAISVLARVKTLKPISAEGPEREFEFQPASLAAQPAFLTPAQPAQEVVRPLLVDDFNQGGTSGVFSQRRNSLGAYQGTWAKRPAWTVIRKSSEHKLGPQGHSLALEYNYSGQGWCGWYTLLMHPKPGVRRLTLTNLSGIDIAPFNALTFWIKGAAGGERFDIGFADYQMQEYEIDAVYAGPIKSFLAAGVTMEWQKVRVPLRGIAAWMDTSRMGSLVFWFKYEGRGKIYVEDVQFEYDPEIARWEAENAPRAPIDPERPRALWIWKIDPVANLPARAELFKICRDSGTGILFLYMGSFSEESDPARAAQLAEFLSQAHKLDLKVHILEGNPIWTKREYHPALLNWMEGYLKFNASRPREESLDGVSLDVEPYLTAEWSSERDAIKAEYLELLGKVRVLVESYGQDFTIGAAIPNLYEKEEEADGFESEVLKRVDYVALMDYYDTARDITAKGRFHVELADRLGTDIWIGVETQDLIQMKQGKRRNTFIEEGWEKMEEELGQVHKAFSAYPHYRGIAIHAYYSYRQLQRGRNVPTRAREAPPFAIAAGRRDSPITIDGDLDDWDMAGAFEASRKNLVTFGPGAWLGPDDLSLKAFKAQWDEEYVYFAFEVADDTIIQEARGEHMWEGDHVELWLDMDIKGDEGEAVNSDDDYQLGFSPGNFRDVVPEIHLWVPALDIPPQGLGEIAARRTAEGYTLEARVPASTLFAYNPKLIQTLSAATQLGIFIDTSDCDEVSNPQESLISSSEERIWGDPTTFGVLELKEKMLD